jgi:hypothetical protein
MNVKIPKPLFEAIGPEPLKQFNLDERKFNWAKYVDLDLGKLPKSKLRFFRKLVAPHTKVRGTGILLKDIDAWLKVVEGEGSAKPRSVEQFKSFVTEVLARAPGHRLYRKDEERGVWLCYYVNKTEYHPEYKTERAFTPARADLDLIWLEFGKRRQDTVVFHEEDCVGIAPEEALLRRGYFIETKEMRAQYLKDVEKFNGLVNNIGEQYLATGVATDDVDGNEKAHQSGWWSSQTHTIRLEKQGSPANVVVDLFAESEEIKHDSDAYVSKWFWNPHVKEILIERAEEEDEDDDDGRHQKMEEMDVEDLIEAEEVEIPLHPMVACFDLKRQRRLRIHVAQMEKYIYDPSLREKLVLPKDVRTLVEMLLGHKGVFKDIIAGKGGGAIILCAGKPGTGKTLTSEVYSEVEGRPLYSVQASQLGTDPNELEEQLMKVFLRAQRWNAILLLDEADVYVAERGRDLMQNAIVGVFLRVLEYYSGVLFLTTNRSDLVDDAIASRCIARVDYGAPPTEDLRRIWNILSETILGAALDTAIIDGLVQKFPKLSGRDVKNLLKLSKLVSATNGKPVDVDTVAFVKRFKPTQDMEE